MNVKEKRRSAKTSIEQYQVYLNYLEANELFRNNKFDPKRPDLLKTSWDELSPLLNSAGGPKRDIDGWKRVFVDWRCQVKRKARLLRLDELKTGGGEAEANKPLSALEERLLGIMNKVIIIGVPGLPEGGVQLPHDSETVHADIELVESVDIEQVMNHVVPSTSATNAAGGSDTAAVHVPVTVNNVETNSNYKNGKKKLQRSKMPLPSASEKAISTFEVAQRAMLEKMDGITGELQNINEGIQKIAASMNLMTQVTLLIVQQKYNIEVLSNEES